MTEPESNIALACIATRLELLLKGLHGEVEAARQDAERGGDEATADFVRVVEAALSNLEQGFADLRKHSSAPADERLLYFEACGSNLSVLESMLGSIEGAIPPRMTPLVSSFERLLSQLIPGRRAVFVHERMCSYELEPIPARDFDTLMETAPYKWPVLIITLPTGLLNSPLSHVLVGHELGHAIAEVERTSSPEVSSPFGDAAEVPPKKIYDITTLRWTELNRPPINDAPKDGQLTLEQILFRGMYGTTMAELRGRAENWIEELFADAVGTCIFGSAYVLAFVEYFLPLSVIDQPSAEHPSMAMRLLCMRDALAHPALKFANALPEKLGQRLDAVYALASSAISRSSDPSAKSEIAKAQALNEVVQDAVAGVVEKAVKVCAKHLYTGAHLSRDLGQYLDDLVQRGVPPISEHGAPAVSLATILNVGQVAALDAIEDFSLGHERAEKERVLAGLLLKAIELAEFQITWNGTR